MSERSNRLLAWAQRLLLRSKEPRPRTPAVPTSSCYFTRLGVTEDAGAEEIAAAYSRLKSLHVGNPRLVAFLEEAYRVVGDAERREIQILVRQGLRRIGHAAPASALRVDEPNVFARLAAILAAFLVTAATRCRRRRK